MTETVMQALSMLWQGMLGIFVVISVIALIVGVLAHFDNKPEKAEAENE